MSPPSCNRWFSRRDVSPFTHIPKLPGGQMTVTPLLLLVAIAAVLTTTGLVGLNRRVGRT